MTAVFLSCFWAMQVMAALLQKWGSAGPGRWWYGFLLANLFGAPSLLFAMKVYQRMNPNVAMAVASGGAFLFAQLALAYFFPSRHGVVQIIGLTAVGVGMILATSAGGKVGS
jgi:multidrug transporter EmrE-like cation transporter